MGHVYLKFLKKLMGRLYSVSMTSSSFLCILIPRIFNFSNFDRIQARIWFWGRFGALISMFNSKMDKTSSFNEKVYDSFDFRQVQSQ